jgi:putative hemolysin
LDLSLIIELVLFAVLMGFSGFFSSAETSLFSLSKLELEQMRRNDNHRVSLIERLLSEPRRLIVTILIGNEFVNVAASVISAAIVIQVLGAENKLFNLFIMVPILLLVGEITPKTLAIRNNMAFATVQSRPIELFARAITPLRWVVRLVAEWFTTLIVGKELTRSNIVTKDMVRALAQEAVGDGVLDRNEAQYIEQIFDFGNRTVEELMTPRSNVFFLPVEMPVRDVVQELKRTRHTKVPIYREHRDEIIGILHARDLLSMNLEELEQQPEQLINRLREPYFVPETKTASDLFHAFRKRRLSVALVVDEYGGVTGLISMEDLLECIFGDIPSPSDAQEDQEMEVLEDGTTQIDASMPMEEFNREIERMPDEEGIDTIGGRVLHAFGELPPEGASLALHGMEFTVVSVEGNRIKTLAITRQASQQDEENAQMAEVFAMEGENPPQEAASVPQEATSVPQDSAEATEKNASRDAGGIK